MNKKFSTNEKNDILKYCEENSIVYDIINNDIIELVEDVSLNNIGRLVLYFYPLFEIKIKFVILGGLQYAFRLYKE